MSNLYKITDSSKHVKIIKDTMVEITKTIQLSINDYKELSTSVEGDKLEDSDKEFMNGFAKLLEAHKNTSDYLVSYGKSMKEYRTHKKSKNVTMVNRTAANKERKRITDELAVSSYELLCDLTSVNPYVDVVVRHMLNKLKTKKEK